MKTREIKFRVWDKKLMHTVGNLYWCQGGLKWEGPGVGQGWCYLDPNFDWSYDIDRNDKPKNVDILMQWTGLKDCNDTDIYEGDLVKINMGYIADNALIEKGTIEVQWGGHWKTAGFGLHGKRPEDTADWETEWTWDQLNPEYAKDCEVIGNIYEDSELLNNKEK